MMVDNSTLSHYTTCNMYAMLSDVLHRKSGADGEAAWFGKMFHKFIEHYWQPGDKWKQIVVDYDEKLEQFLDQRAAMGRFSEGDRIKPELFRNMIKQFAEQLPRAFSADGSLLLLDHQTMKPLYKIIHRPEIGFKFPLGQHEIIGRMDTLVEDFNGTLWIIDIKTFGEYNRDKQTGEAIPRYTWIEQFRMNTQATTYIRALQYHTDQPIGGMLILAVPRAMGKLKIEHIRVRRTEQELEQWEMETEMLANRFSLDAEVVEESLDNLRFIPATGKYNGACTRYGLCTYFDICKSNYNPQIIEQSTVFKPWSPLDPQEED